MSFEGKSDLKHPLEIIKFETSQFKRTPTTIKIIKMTSLDGGDYMKREVKETVDCDEEEDDLSDMGSIGNPGASTDHAGVCPAVAAAADFAQMK